MKVDNEALRNRVEMFGEEAGGYIYRLESKLSTAESALRLYAKYAPLSGDMALLIRASQSGGQEAADRADRLVEHYSHLDEAYDAARAILNPIIAGEPDVA